MANTFELISSVTVGSGGVSTFSFTSIPSTYTDLCLRLSLKGTGTALPDVIMQFNGDSGSNYATKELAGTGGALSSNGPYTTTNAHFQMNSTDTTASTFTNTEVYIPNYSISGVAKMFSSDAVNENNSVSTYVQIRIIGWKWTGTAAINSILFSTNVGAYAQYSTAYLYGIKKS